jgi:Fe-S cluster assembly protein SufD
MTAQTRSAEVWADLAAAARARAGELPQPGPEREEWRAVDHKALRASLQAHPVGAGESPDHDHASILTVGDATPTDEDTAGPPTWPGVTATPFATLAPAAAAVLAARWKARLAEATDAAACWPHLHRGGGWHIVASAKAQVGVERPLFLTLAAHSSEGASATRIAIDIAPGAALTLVILHAALAPGRSHVLIDATLGRGAALIVEEAQTGPAADESILLVDRHVRLDHDAGLTWTTVADGAALARFATVVDLAGTGAHADVGGLANPEGRTQVHHHLALRHRAGMTTSHQQFRAVVADHARAGCDGIVRIDHGADGSNASQRINNLLLSAHARADSRPRLDIHADDVQAAHGAATGALDREELFYLRARGLDDHAATALLVRGFATTVLERLRTPEGRSWIAEHDD